MRDQHVAELPQAELDEDMLAAMRLKVGTRLRIEHSVNNDYASPIAIARFAGGIGDINPLWTNVEYGNRSPFGASVAPPRLTRRRSRIRSTPPGCRTRTC